MYLSTKAQSPYAIHCSHSGHGMAGAACCNSHNSENMGPQSQCTLKIHFCFLSSTLQSQWAWGGRRSLLYLWQHTCWGRGQSRKPCTTPSGSWRCLQTGPAGQGRRLPSCFRPGCHQCPRYSCSGREGGGRVGVCTQHVHGHIHTTRTQVEAPCGRACHMSVERGAT